MLTNNNNNMMSFFEVHKQAIYFVLIVIAITIALLIFGKLVHKYLVIKALKRFPDEEPNTINTVKRIFNTITVLLSISAISFVFIDKQYYEAATTNFWTTVYLGIVLIFTIISVSITQTYFTRNIHKKINDEEDPTSFKFLRYLSIVGIYLTGGFLFIIAFPSLRGIAHTALGGAGIIAVIAGVASQEALANVIGGVFIIMFKPFKINDIIKLSDELVGSVIDITLRHTIIKNYENKMIVIPNAIINKEKIVNYDLGDRKCCQWIEMDIAYDSDVDLAKNILRNECESHPNIVDNRTIIEINQDIPKVIVRVVRLKDSSVTLRAWAWSRDYASAFIMKCDLNESVKKRFELEGIEIPFPYQNIILKK